MSEYGRGGQGYVPLWGSRKDPHRRAVRYRPCFPRVSVSVSVSHTHAHTRTLYWVLFLMTIRAKSKTKRKARVMAQSRKKINISVNTLLFLCKYAVLFQKIPFCTEMAGILTYQIFFFCWTF